MLENKSVEEVLKDNDLELSQGLSLEEVKKRQASFGANVLAQKKLKTKLQMFLAQLNEPMMYILFAAAVISAFLKEFSDAVIVIIVVLLNAIIGMIQEGKAQDALESLKKLSSPNAVVRRAGKIEEIPASELVVGDVVLLEAGRQVPADLRLIISPNLQIEESALTGESVAVEKEADFVAQGQLPLGDRINMAYMTTNVTYGRGEGVVSSIGMETEIGKIAKMIQEAPEEATPLQKRLADLGKVLGVVAVLLCIGLFVIAILQKRDIAEMLITAISLAVAAVPEGLPAVVTIVLALGVQRLVKVNTIVRRLPSVETLGSVSVVCSDKTGTLTQNKMTVQKCYVNGTLMDVKALKVEENKDFMEGFVLCNDAILDGDRAIGDPTEIALLEMGKLHNCIQSSLLQTYPRVQEMPFDSVRKMMTTQHDIKGQAIAFTKGAVDQVIVRCQKIMDQGQIRDITEADKADILVTASSMSQEALRVLALAQKNTNEKITLVKDNNGAISEAARKELGLQPLEEENLIFVGLVGMIDPPRPEAKDAVAIFKGASVKTVMITGDHKDTALAIARELGIAEMLSECITGEDLEQLSDADLAKDIEKYSVFARVSPEHKVKIVNALKAKGNIVSMTGDGVNDAPSLQAADIGVAMGITGTDVAKSAADMVLTDDNFATIEKAIEEGRGIYANIKKSVLFLLSSNFGEIITMFTAILVGLATPLKAIHILWVNLITDSLPGLALGVDKNEATDLMKKPPRDPKESLFAGNGLLLIIFYGFIIGVITLTAFLSVPYMHLKEVGDAFNLSNAISALKSPEMLSKAQTFAFTVLGVSQLFHAIGMRNIDKSVFRMKHKNNRLMIVAFFVGFLLQIAVTEVPFLVAAFETTELSLQNWLYLTALGTVPLWFHEIIVIVRKIMKKA